VRDAPLAIVGTSFTANRKLSLFLSHFSQKNIIDASEPGLGPEIPLIKFLESREKKALPSILFFEIPNHIAISKLAQRISVMGEVFQLLEPSSVTVLLGKEAAGISGEEFVHRNKEYQAAVIEKGRVVHSGNGSVSLRLRGRVTGGDFYFVVKTGAGTMSATWKPNRIELILPVAGYKPLDGLSVFIPPSTGEDRNAKLHLKSVELVTDLDLDNPVLGVCEEVESAPGGWSQRIEFLEPVPLRSFDALQIELALKGAFNGRLEVELHPAGTTGEMP
jgi:hypothetical protein